MHPYQDTREPLPVDPVTIGIASTPLAVRLAPRFKGNRGGY